MDYFCMFSKEIVWRNENPDRDSSWSGNNFRWHKETTQRILRMEPQHKKEWPSVNCAGRISTPKRLFDSIFFRSFDIYTLYISMHIYKFIFSQILIDGRDTSAVDNEGSRLPTLVYMAREKRPNWPHNFKAGAMNALVSLLHFFLKTQEN